MKKTNRIVAFILSVVMLWCVIPVAAIAEEAPVNTDVATEEVADLEIGTKEELVAFANRVNAGENFEGKLVALTADIDLGNMTWTPIGYDSYGTNPEDAVSFNGTFDGRGHTISNLTDAGYIPTIITHGEYGFGLFGYAYGANFKNITLENVSIHADGLEVADGAGVAALVGYYRIKNGSSFVFENCHLNSGSIYATNNMGGLVGYMYGLATNADNLIFNLDGKFVNCTNSAVITTRMREAGGIVGLFDMKAVRDYLKVYGDVVFENCKNYGKITANNGADNSVASGILGRDNTGALWYFGGRLVFVDCYNGGEITAYGKPSSDEIHASGIATVYNVGGMTAAFKNCTNAGVVQAIDSNKAYCGEIISFSGYAMIEHCTVTDYSKLYGFIARMLFVEQPGVTINENAGALLYLNGAKAPEILTFGQKGGQAEENIVAREDYFFDGWYDNPEFTGENVLFNNGGNDSGIFYAKFITFDEVYERTEAGETIDFEANVENTSFVIDKDLTLDLNGFTLTLNSISAYALRAATPSVGMQIAEGTNVTIKNGTITGEAAILVENYSNLTLVDVVLDGSNLDAEDESAVLVNRAGTASLENCTIVAPVDVPAIEVEGGADDGVILDDNSTVGGDIVLEGGKLSISDLVINEPGNYNQYEGGEIFRMDDYAFTLTTDTNALKATESLNVTVSIDKDYYSAEYTFEYDPAKFSCAADTDNDGKIYVTNLYRGIAGDLATYTLVAKNDIASVSNDNIIKVDGNVIQYKEQVVNNFVSNVEGDLESIKISLNYTAEVKVEYVPGYSLVLVYGQDGGYAYNGVKMFYVEAYGAYAVLVEGAVTDEMIDVALSKATGCRTLAPTYDVNCDYVADGVVDLKDATAIYACSSLDFVVADYMDLFLRSDVNGDYKADMADINAVTANYTAR